MSVVLKHDSLNSHANSFPPYGTMSLISIYTPYVQARPDLNPELQLASPVIRERRYYLDSLLVAPLSEGPVNSLYFDSSINCTGWG